MCILCAVREELTYICRVCLTKSLSSVLVGREVYPLFSGREGWHYVLIFGLSSVLSGREGWHYVLIFGLSSVLSGREG